MEIPSVFTYIATGVVVTAYILFWITTPPGIEKQLLQTHFSTIIGAGIVTTAIVYLTREKALGAGDIFVSVIIAAGATPIQFLLTIVFASWAGSIYGIGVYAKTKQLKGKRIPLIPFLTIGYACSHMFGTSFLTLLGFTGW